MNTLIQLFDVDGNKVHEEQLVRVKPFAEDVLLSYAFNDEECKMELGYNFPEGVDWVSFDLSPVQKEVSCVRSDGIESHATGCLFSIVSIKEAFETVIRAVDNRFSVFASMYFQRDKISTIKLLKI